MCVLDVIILYIVFVYANSSIYATIYCLSTEIKYFDESLNHMFTLHSFIYSFYSAQHLSYRHNNSHNFGKVVATGHIWTDVLVRACLQQLEVCNSVWNWQKWVHVNNIHYICITSRAKVAWLVHFFGFFIFSCWFYSPSWQVQSAGATEPSWICRVGMHWRGINRYDKKVNNIAPGVTQAKQVVTISYLLQLNCFKDDFYQWCLILRGET